MAWKAVSVMSHQSLGQFDVSQTPRGSREILNIHRVRRE